MSDETKTDEVIAEETNPQVGVAAVLTIQVIGHRYDDDSLKINGVAQEDGEWPDVIQFAGVNWRFQDVDNDFGDDDEDDEGNTVSQELADYVQD